MPSPIGPIDSGHVEEVVVTEGGVNYHIGWFADANNDELQRANKPPKFWRVPMNLRMAKDPDTGEYKFKLLHYVGVRDEATHVGDTRDLAGGRLAFTVTSDPPEGVIQKAQEQLIQRLKERNPGGKYWRLFGTNGDNPTFGVVPMQNVNVTVTNLGIDQLLPDGGGGEADERGLPGVPRVRFKDTSAPIPESRLRNRRDMMDDLRELLWARLDGEGEAGMFGGPVSVSGNISSDLAGILWQDFQGGNSTVTVYMDMDLELWSPTMELSIEGDWERVFDHFSAAASGRNWWFEGDISVELEKIITDGTLDVDIKIDGTKPGADELEETINQRADFITKQFMEQATKAIFDPAPPNVDAAEANARKGFFGGLFGSGAFELKKKYERRELSLKYNEKRTTRYLKHHRADGHLRGFFNELQEDPDAIDKYFTRVDLTDWARKVQRVVTPVVNWPEPGRVFVGDPVETVFVSVGYPNMDGNVDWNGTKFTASGPVDWTFKAARKDLSQVSDPPDGWSPEDTFVRRRVILKEPSGENDSRFVRTFVERNSIDLDPEEGTMISDLQIEARADSVGKFELGPIAPFIDLERGQAIELELQPLGENADGGERPITRFTWTGADVDETGSLRKAYYERYTGEQDLRPAYRYRVTVRIMGTISSRGEEWTGPWHEFEGNGELLFNVPLKEDVDSQHVRRLDVRELDAGLYGSIAGPGLRPRTVTIDRRAPAVANPGAEADTVSGYSLNEPVDARTRAPSNPEDDRVWGEPAEEVWPPETSREYGDE